MVDKNGPVPALRPELGPCHLWTGSCDECGYGLFGVSRPGRERRTHRIAYTLEFGPIPKGLVVRHKCDVRNCLNTKHLELGTQGKNQRDCVARGRLGKRTRFTEEDMVQMRTAFREGATIRAISLERGASYQTIWCALHTGQRGQSKEERVRAFLERLDVPVPLVERMIAVMIEG